MTVFENRPTKPAAQTLLIGHPLGVNSDGRLPDSVDTASSCNIRHEPTAVIGAAAKGFVMGVPDTLIDYGSTIKQTFVDIKTIRGLQAARKSEILASGEKESVFEKSKRRVGKTALVGWYSSIFPAYQLLDDPAMYALYTHVQAESGIDNAYGIAAVAGFGLAAATGLGQRLVEKAKAKLMHVETSVDKSDHVRRLLDASVNSSMWQVALSAARPRESGEAVPIVSKFKAAQYAAAYAIVNTGLYTVADSLPGNKWAGFGVSLATVWSVGGAYSAVKQHLRPNRESL